MTDRAPVERVPLSEWNAESLRATVFPSADAEVSPSSWWRNVLGDEPETQVIQSRTGQRQEQGTFHGARLRLQIQPARIDWTLSPILSDAEPPQGFPAVGNFEKLCQQFRELMLRWLPFSPLADRIAFGATTLLPIASRADGYRRLSAYLPAVKLDADNSSDFQYRINRPRPSKAQIERLRINRLSTWTVIMLDLRTVILGAREEPRVLTVEPIFACRVELDINTSAQFEGKLNPSQSEKLLDEMMDLAKKILESGDHP